MISNVGSQPLTKMAREGTVEEYQTALKEAGVACLQNAMDIFSRRDRTLEEGRLAVDRLSDLKESIAANLLRTNDLAKKDGRRVYEEVEQLKHGTHPLFHLQPAKIEYFKDAQPITVPPDPRAKYPNLRRETDADSAVIYNFFKPVQLGGVQRFLRDLTQVQGLCITAALMPGPLAPSVLAAGKSISATPAQAGQASAEPSTAGPDTTTHGDGESSLEERILPSLAELRDRLPQATVIPAQVADITCAPGATKEYSGRRSYFGLGPVVYDPREIGFAPGGDGKLLETLEHAPAYLRLPDTSISDYMTLA